MQLTVQFNREMGRNPEDGQTEVGYATFCTGGKRHGPDAHQPGFIDTRGAVDNPSPESANLKQYRSGHDGTTLDNPRLTMLQPIRIQQWSSHHAGVPRIAVNPRQAEYEHWHQISLDVIG